jgi:phospholipid/cholesterol/gamma-HCH transport system substrate-binding protein
VRIRACSSFSGGSLILLRFLLLPAKQGEAMATPRQKTLVGIFLSVCGLLLVAVLALLSGVRHEETVAYFIEFNETVSGLFPGADVRYRGVPVGRVTDITVTPSNRVRVRVEIRPSVVELRYGVTAQLNPSGITGQLYINLEGGNPEGDLVPPRSTIPAAPSLFANLSSALPTLLASINSILLRLDDSLGGEGGAVTTLRDVRDLIATLNTTVSAAGPQVLTILDRLNALTEQEVQDLMTELVTSARAVRRFFERNEPALQQALTSGTSTLQLLEQRLQDLDLQGTNARLQRTLQRISGLVEQLSSTGQELTLTMQQTRADTTSMEFQFRQAVRSWRETLQSARELLDYLERNPSALLTGRPAPNPSSDGQRR